MSDDRLDSLDYYTLLGVAEDASIDAVKSSFRSFARKYHPDRFSDAEEDKRARATRIFRRGSEAFQTLTDPVQRKAYDHALAHGKLRLTDDGRVSDPRMTASSAGAGRATQPGARDSQAGRTSQAHPTSTPELPAARAAAAAVPANPIQSEQAQAYFKRAVEAAKSQDWITAWKALRAAMQIEPGNAFLETRFQQVDAMVRKNG